MGSAAGRRVFFVGAEGGQDRAGNASMKQKGAAREGGGRRAKLKGVKKEDEGEG